MTSNGAALLGRVGEAVFQHSWVVRDLAAASACMPDLLGCSEFTTFEMDHAWTVRGRAATSRARVGLARAGDTQIELIEPIDGESVHAEFLERRGPGFHHLGSLVTDLGAATAAAADLGFVVLMSGQFGPSTLCYLDTFNAMGFYIELIEDPSRVLWAACPWRDEYPRWSTTGKRGSRPKTT